MRRSSRIVVAFALAGVSACASEAAGPSVSPSTITVTVSMAGNAVPADGFSVAIADTTLRFTGAGTQQVAGVRGGSYTARLVGLAGNCAADSSSWTIAVPSGSTATLSIGVECYGGFAYTASGAPGGGAGLYYLGVDGRTSLLASASAQAVVRDWSRDGRHLIVEHDESNGGKSASIINVDGSPVRVLSSSPAGYPRFSPNGSTIVYCTLAIPAGYTLHVTDVAGTFDRPAVAPSGPFQDCFAAWSPDGSQIAFQTNRFETGQEPNEFAVVRSDGSGVHPIGGAFGMTGPTTAWSPDGRFVAGVLSPTGLATTRPSLGVVPANGGSMTVAWSSDSIVQGFAWSPDATQLAIDDVDFVDQTFESVMLVNPDGTGRRALAPSLWYSANPSWSSDGARLLLVGPDTGTAAAIYVVHPDGTHLHAIVRGALYLYPMWQPTAKPGGNDRGP